MASARARYLNFPEKDPNRQQHLCGRTKEGYGGLIESSGLLSGLAPPECSYERHRCKAEPEASGFVNVFKMPLGTA